MKTAREFADDLLDAAPDFSAFYELVSARDAEHAAVIAALQRTVETLGADVLRLAGQLEQAVEFLRRANVGTLLPRALRDNINDFIRDLAAPQPEPVKAHACDYPDACSHPSHAPAGCGR